METPPETRRESLSDDWKPRRLTHAEARLEQLRYWQTKSMAERLEAMTELNNRMRAMRGYKPDGQPPDLTPRRVPRRKR